MPSTDDSDIDDDNDNDILIEENDDDVPEDFEPTTFFESQKQLCYFKMIDKFFKKCPLDLREKMVKIINSESIISLRVLEWVVTKSSSKTINIKLSDNEYYSINIMYKAQLKSYKKKNFDFFRRDRKFRYVYDKDTNIIITRNIENKPIYKFDFDTKKILQIFQSTKEAAIHFEITTSTILRYIAVEKIFSNKKDTNKNILLSYSNNIDNLEINQITKVIKPRRFKKLYTYYNNSIQLFFEYKGPSDAAAKLKIGQCTVHRHINNKKPLNIIYNNERISIIFSYTSF